MITKNPQSDPITLLVTLGTLVFAPDVAAHVAPYLIIIFSANIGAGFALAARPEGNRTGGAWFYIRVSGLAVVLTYGIASVVNLAYPLNDIRNWFGIVAFCIGLVGDRWMQVGTWAAGKLSMLIDVWIELRKGKGGHD